MVILRAVQVSASMTWRALLLCVPLAGCGGSVYERFDGATMGTYYSVTARCEGRRQALEEDVGSILERVNGEMSTYDPTSTLSRFNSASDDAWFPVEASLLSVVESALSLSRQSDGAFDVTVGPLVNLWGFGPEPFAGEPDPAALTAARARVGFERLEVRRNPPALRKTAGTYVDLSAIAKGHGVDRVAAALEDAGCRDYLVDIGGEVRVRGHNRSGGRWRIGVEVPDPGSQGGVQRIIELSDAAVATSGDYRNFREADGRRLSHTIDPRSGRPVEHALASVTVVHESAMWADGYATAFSVLGAEAAMALAQSLELPVLLVLRTPGGFEERYNAAMELLLKPL